MLSRAQALAVAGAIQTILDLSRPFEGVIRVSGQPLRHAIDVINQPIGGSREILGFSRSPKSPVTCFSPESRSFPDQRSEL
jgi:hypothetical protein